MQLRALRMYCRTTINNCTVKCNSFSLNNILKSTYNHYPHFMDFYFLQRWVWAFRKERLLVHVSTKNGLERQNGAFKHQYLQTLRKHSLSAMLTILVNEFLPDKYEG